MELIRHIGPEQILLGVRVKDKWELLDRMIAAVLEGPVCRRQDAEVLPRIGESVLHRERRQSTGIGGGFAFPHARVPGFSGLVVSLAVLAEPLDYGAVDGKPVRIACLVVTPEEAPTVAVRVMGAILRLLADEAVHEFFLHQSDPAKLYEYLKGRDVNLGAAITARDIMRSPVFDSFVDTPLREVTRRMMQHSLEAVSVQDRDGRLVGEITCDLLFKKGMPDFFSQLASVGFIKNFDPFEKYFEQEANSVAADVMSDDFAAVPETATLMEIVYLLSVRGYWKVYVVREGKRIGVIDRAAVLDRILNL